MVFLKHILTLTVHPAIGTACPSSTLTAFLSGEVPLLGVEDSGGEARALEVVALPLPKGIPPALPPLTSATPQYPDPPWRECQHLLLLIKRHGDV